MHLPITALWDGAPAAPAEHVSLVLRRQGEDLLLQIDAPHHGDPPPPGPAGPTWALWEHEVVELFLLGPEERYLEVEIGPHGHHLVLRLEGRRQAVATLLPLDVQWAPGATRWSATARLPRALLPPEPWRGNAYAIWGTGAARRYLAWAPVPGPAPDFHRLACFPALTL